MMRAFADGILRATLSPSYPRRSAPLRPVSVVQGLKGDFFLVPRARRTKFRALSPRCNPALNIQKRDRPAKRAEELVHGWSDGDATSTGGAFHMLIGIRHFLMAPT